jgi:hypothetical protein
MTLLAHFWHEKVLSIKAKRVATEKLVHSMVRTGPIRESPTVGLDVVHIAGSRQHVTATPSLATIPVEVPISGRAPPPWSAAWLYLTQCSALLDSRGTPVDDQLGVW